MSVIVVSTTNALSDLNRANAENRRSASYQAAEAGVADYLAKLTEDHAYYLHTVHPAESTRRNSTSTLYAAGQTWDGSSTWTYPTAVNAWRTLPNGYEYNLEVTGPTATKPVVTVISTGRKQNAKKEDRRVEVEVRPSSIADFMMIANRDVSYGSSATTYGKIYAGIDEVGTAHSVDHAGNAYADVYAENQVTSLTVGRLFNGARAIDSDSTPLIRSVIKSPINFSAFTGSLVDVRAAAGLAAGILLDDASVEAWQLTFNADATVTIDKCITGGQDPAGMSTKPTCNAFQTKPMPTNGAIYVGQTAIVRGVVDGQVTVVSNNNIVVGENITYELPGNDVLGLIAKNETIMAYWSTPSLTIYAAMIAQGGQYRSWTGTLTKAGTYTHVGSVATNKGGYMSMFATRVYQYDTNLQFLQPPYYPVLGEAYSIQSYREVTPPVIP